MSSIVHLDAGTEADVAALGGKGAGLAFLARLDIRIPPAFVVTADGYRHALDDGVRNEVAARLAGTPRDAETEELARHGAAARQLILDATHDHRLTEPIRSAFDELRARAGDEQLCVAVRSSSIAEDAADRSYAGEHDTYLWVADADELDLCVRRCWASLATERALAYRADAGGDATEEPAMAVVVQQMAPARSAGVLMTLNPVNGDRSKVMIESAWGLGEPLVSGQITPDRFLADKVTGEIVSREIAHKPREVVRDPLSGRGVALVAVDEERAAQPALSDAEIEELLRIARVVEREAGGPQDIEFAVVPGDPPDNTVLLQCRPETVWSQRPATPRAAGRTAMDAVLATLTGGSPGGAG